LAGVWMIFRRAEAPKRRTLQPEADTALPQA
jgi:hypothetical protein